MNAAMARQFTREIPPRLLRSAKPITAIVSPDYERGAPYNRPGRSCAGGSGYCRSREPRNAHASSAYTGRSPSRGLTANYESTAPGQCVRVKPMPHFDAIVAEAERVGWPRDYRADLFVHDRAALDKREPSVPFLWVLRDSGSSLFFVGERDGVGHDAAHFATSVPEIFGAPSCRLYTWDGTRLHAHRTPETAADAVRVLLAGVQS
jgi:hypothetical protein